MPSRDHLIIFTRFPVPGEVKTRLIPALGTDGAATLQRRMTEHTVAQARKTDTLIEVRTTGGSLEQMRDWLGKDLLYAEQGAGDLGKRMVRAFEDHFDAGVERPEVSGCKQVVLVGCDCPSNGWKNMAAAFQCLENNDCVIGPASDGGYYLIGLSRPMPELFEGIDWGTERVLKQTLAAAPFKPVLLPELDDVDQPSDIPPKISVIIPMRNEADHILQTLEKVNEGFDAEVVVVDCGSTDGTVNEVQKRSPHLLRCGEGRAAQQNPGAAAATGEILLFYMRIQSCPITGILSFGRH